MFWGSAETSRSVKVSISSLLGPVDISYLFDVLNRFNRHGKDRRQVLRVAPYSMDQRRDIDTG